MSYVDKNLMDGEQVFYRARRHWTIFGGAIAFLCVGVALSVGVRVWGPSEWAGDVSLIVLALGILATLIKAIPAWIDRTTSEFAVTNKRVIIKVGWVRRRSLETLLSKVEGIEVNQGICGRVFDYGTIVITGTGGSKETFEQIGAPLLFRRKVQEQIIALQAQR
jgi:membrane protein YdbS with pleckstrin-like domain